MQTVFLLCPVSLVRAVLPNLMMLVGVTPALHRVAGCWCCFAPRRFAHSHVALRRLTATAKFHGLRHVIAVDSVSADSCET